MFAQNRRGESCTTVKNVKDHLKKKFSDEISVTFDRKRPWISVYGLTFERECVTINKKIVTIGYEFCLFAISKV